LLTSDGKVDVAGSEKLLALRPGIYRGGKIKAAPGEKQATGKDVPPILDRSPEEIADSTKWTLIEAQRVKEVYLALLRKQEFEIEQGELVEIEAVGREVEREYSMFRERLLTIPGKVSASLAGCDRAVRGFMGQSGTAVTVALGEGRSCGAAHTCACPDCDLVRHTGAASRANKASSRTHKPPHARQRVCCA
jgi:hypothetical protein